MLMVTEQAAKATSAASSSTPEEARGVRCFGTDCVDLEKVKGTAVSVIFHDLVHHAYANNWPSTTTRSTPRTACRIALLTRCLGHDQRPDATHLND